MELSIPIDFINNKNIYFVDKKKNIIVEGDFVKVVYSTESFEMNGVYIAIDFCIFPKSTYSSIPLCTEVRVENTSLIAEYSRKSNVHKTRSNRIEDPIPECIWQLVTTQNNVPFTLKSIHYIRGDSGLNKNKCKSISSSLRECVEKNPDTDYIFEMRNGIPSIDKINVDSTLKLQQSLPHFTFKSTPSEAEMNLLRECVADCTGTNCVKPTQLDIEPSDKSWIQIINKNLQNRVFSDYLRSKTPKRTDENVKIDTSRNTKKNITFDPNSNENKTLIEKLCKFEHNLIKRYIDENCPRKTAIYILKNQLMTNTIKYHSENRELCKKPSNIERYILKVSGVWETATTVGITMKFTLVC